MLGLARGGVPVAAEVAGALGARLDVLVARKLGFPGQRELAMGAIASGGVHVLNRDVVQAGEIGEAEIERAVARELEVLERQEEAFRGQRQPLEVQGATVILIDDGLATGATMRAAIEAVRRRGARRIVVGVPTAPVETCESLRREVDEVLCEQTPAPFTAVGVWYRDFEPVSDEEVRRLLVGDGV